jgi:NADH dehydrogenase
LKLQLSKPRVVIIGAGFGGLQAAKSLRNSKYDIVLIDRTNYHLFQPLLYQVASSALSPGEIATPVRTILRGYDNIQVIMNEALSINLDQKNVELLDGYIEFDYLILAPGARHSYFGNENWEQFAPGLKSLEDALKIRENMLISFEKAERLYKTNDFHKYLTFVIIGGGPTGVEMAGAVSEISRKNLLPDYPLINNDDIKVILIESNNCLLHSYPQKLSVYTLKALKKLGVDVRLNTRVHELGESLVKINDEIIECNNIIWAAGNQASPILKSLNTDLDNSGRVLVNSDLSLKENRNVFVIGDSAFIKDSNGNNVPGIAPAAIQEAKYVASIIKSKVSTAKRKPFKYFDKGSMATIGKAKAVAMIGSFHITGFIAWMMWSFIHIFFLIDFRNRLRVITEWIWFYITNRPGARLIVHKNLDKMTETMME